MTLLENTTNENKEDSMTATPVACEEDVVVPVASAVVEDPSQDVDNGEIGMTLVLKAPPQSEVMVERGGDMEDESTPYTKPSQKENNLSGAFDSSLTEEVTETEAEPKSCPKTNGIIAKNNDDDDEGDNNNEKKSSWCWCHDESCFCCYLAPFRVTGDAHSQEACCQCCCCCGGRGGGCDTTCGTGSWCGCCESDSDCCGELVAGCAECCGMCSTGGAAAMLQACCEGFGECFCNGCGLLCECFCTALCFLFEGS